MNKVWINNEHNLPIYRSRRLRPWLQISRFKKINIKNEGGL